MRNFLQKCHNVNFQKKSLHVKTTLCWEILILLWAGVHKYWAPGEC